MFMIVHMNVHKNKKILETILKSCERPEIQDVNVSSINISGEKIS
jgi:hypothetical protein